MDLKESCGIFGVFGLSNAAEITYLGLFSLQHRGQESAGIVVSDGKVLREKKGMGLVSEVFHSSDFRELRGHVALGHVRYSTTGSSSMKNAQPFLGDCRFGELAIAHNGNLTNAFYLRKQLTRLGSVFRSSMDTELILHLIARGQFDNLEDSVKEALWQMRGAFSLGIIAPCRLIAVRDPWGFRPLALGRLNGGYVISSETCAFDILGAELIREIAPGEMVIIDENGVRSFFYAYSSRKAFCVFELIYFARPDSLVFGNSVYEARKRMGQKLAAREFVTADMVIPVPDSGMYAALGFAEFSGIPIEMGFIRNPYVGRTFIRPSQDERELAIDIKLNPLRSLLKNKRVIVIEDSIVRGNTSKRRIATLKGAGVKEVHMRVSSPPHRFPCFYGVDFPSSSELVAFGKSTEEIRRYLGLDSLQYLDIEDLKEIVGESGNNFCFACFNGDYPVQTEKEFAKNVFESI